MTHEQAVNWMAEHGEPQYAEKIAFLESQIRALYIDTGPRAFPSSYVADQLNQLEQQIEDVKAAAWDEWSKVVEYD